MSYRCVDIMSESQYKKHSTTPVSGAASLFDESEGDHSSDNDEIISPPKKIKKQSKPQKKQDSKKKSPSDTCSKSAGSNSVVADLFGDEPQQPSTSSSQPSPLWSSLAQRVAGGALRQVELINDGELFFDVKVYNTVDIINLDSRRRADKWSAQLRLRVAPSDPLWMQVKKIYAEGKKRFVKEAIFYGDKADK